MMCFPTQLHFIFAIFSAPCLVGLEMGKARFRVFWVGLADWPMAGVNKVGTRAVGLWVGLVDV